MTTRRYDFIVGPETASLPTAAIVDSGLLVTKTGNYTVLDSDNVGTIVVSDTSSARTITLPLAANNVSRKIWITDTSAQANDVIIATQGSDLINGTTAVTISCKNESVLVQSDGLGWILIVKQAKRVSTIQDFRAVGTVGLPVNNFSGGAYLASTDFPNTTTLYGWQAPATDSATWTAVYGSKDLTRTGVLDVTTDFLGNSKACSFDGTNDYLSSTDAVFNFTGTFSASMWIYRSNWQLPFKSTSNEIFIGRYSSTGWIFYGLSDTTKVRFYANSTVDAEINVSNLSSGWHNFCFVRTSGSNTKIYIDGTLSIVGTASTITAAGNLEVGSTNGGTNKIIGYVQDVWIHNATAWTDAQVATIYAKSNPSPYNQQFAGHLLTTSEPTISSSETLALYKFASDANILVDEKGTYALAKGAGTEVTNAGIMGGTTGAAYFNGTTQYLTQSTLLDTTPSAIGISFWMKAVDGQPSSLSVLALKVNVSSNHYIEIFLGTNGKISLQVASGSGATQIDSCSVLPNGQTDWVHVVAGWDSINGTRLFINGILEAAMPGSSTLMNSGTSKDFIIGADNFGAITGYFNGWIDEFIVMNKVLTQADVDALYSSTYSIPTSIKGSDYSIEASVRPLGNTAIVRNENIDGNIVTKTASTIYRQGFTQGSGYKNSDVIKIQAR